MTIPFSVNTTSDRQVFRRHSLSTAGILALAIAAMPSIANAQAAPAMMASVEDKAPATGDTTAADTPTVDTTAQDQSASGEAPQEEITVTGSRIVRDGYDAPTPVSVISSKELQAEAPANIADFVNTLPSVRGSSTAANSNGSLSNGLAGVASVNLRNLGSQRTLVLFDGQRSVASATSGVVDVNTFPQALVERVEVVTGGASSAYGSDAVSGVINFILDKKYTGVKGSYEYGVTTYSDGPNHKFTLTAGTPFAGGKGHILVSGEYFTQKGIQSIDRDWNDAGFFQIDNPAYSAAACSDASAATICYPSRLIQGGIGTGQFTEGGLISTGPFKGVYFGQVDATGKASVNNFVFGPSNGQWMVGGDYLIGREGHVSSATLLPSEDRKSGFGRISYEFSPAFELYGQMAYTRYQGQSYYQQTPTTGTTIQIAPSAANGGLVNAFLPTAFLNQVNAYNATPGNTPVTTAAIGTSNIGIPPQGSDNTREVFRYVVGASGDFSLLDREIHWDAYYQKGVTKTNELLTNAWNLDRMALATDAVVAPAGNASGIAAGTIVCRSRLTLANVNNGCVPINRIGIGGVSPEALAYVLYNGLQPLRKQTLKQDVAAFNLFTNNLVDIWAGPISLGFGAEWRHESVTGSVDPLFQPRVANGVTSGTWIYGNYLPTFGKYNVKEAYVETIIPLFKGADFNGAFRLTDYSTSGTVSTWKAGVTWQPIPDVKFRGTISRDIRAPNLGELFAPGTGRTNTVNVPIAGGQRADQFNESTVGNPALNPEVAKTYGVGAVFTPSFVPGLAFSVDYFQIKLSGAINNLTAQTLVTQCYEQSLAAACASISTTGGRGVTTAGLLITSIELKPTNFVGIEAKGIDFEASYRKPIGPGALTLRALVTKNISLYTDNGVDVPTEAAGQNSGSLPDWTYRLTAGYDVGPWGFQLVGRGVSGGVYDNSYVVCSTDCPVSTVANRTVNRNDIAGAIYVDLQVNHEFEIAGAKTTTFLSIKNLLDTDPVLVGNGPTGNNTPAYPQTNRNLYDVLGRVFRVGVRFDF
jgi:outer membrane receptor protein involved in Fe transport